MDNDLGIRPVTQDDALELSKLLNEVIARGGTTALEDPFEPNALASAFLTGPNVICCLVASDYPAGKIIGFQTLGRNEKLPVDVGDIGTFARVGITKRGVGSALFKVMRAEALNKKLSAINATIRADNIGGLAYYKRMGFEDYEVARAVPLKDGTLVDRISKRYLLI